MLTSFPVSNIILSVRGTVIATAEHGVAEVKEHEGLHDWSVTAERAVFGHDNAAEGYPTSGYAMFQCETERTIIHADRLYYMWDGNGLRITCNGAPFKETAK